MPILEVVWDRIVEVVLAVGASLAHLGWILAIAILAAVYLKTYVNTEKLSAFLSRRKTTSIYASVAIAAFTPFCACGTMAIIIGMLATTLPWGAIMAFLTSSPLMSPNAFILISGVIGLRFALALTIASVAIGVLSGWITHWIEKHTKFLEGQVRFSEKAQSCECACQPEPKVIEKAPVLEPVYATGCCSSVPACERIGLGYISMPEPTGLKRFAQKARLGDLFKNFFQVGVKQILLLYAIFVGVGYLIHSLVPSTMVELLFGSGSAGAVPLASIIGLPLYVSTESSIPLVQSMMDSGASPGAMLAFMITGSSTSAWVIEGLSTFLKKG